MGSKDTNFIPYRPEGAPTYSSQVFTQRYGIDLFTPTTLQILDQLVPEKGQSFVIGDYGTADGGTSYQLIRQCIELLRKKFGDELPILIVYEDQPINDFKPIFKRVNGLETHTAGLHLEYTNVYTVACGTSFYSQCLPPNSLDLIFCAHSNHRLSHRPCVLKGTIDPTQAAGKDRELYQHQAATDWETFLVQRAKELKPGGHMLLLNMGSGIPAEYSSEMKVSVDHIYDDMTNLLVDMVNQGDVTQEEFDNMNTGVYFRTLEEFNLPFNDSTSRVISSGLELKAVHSKTFPCPHRAKWLKQKQELRDDHDENALARRHARIYVKERRVSNESTILNGLSGKRPEEEKSAIVNKFFQLYEDLVTTQPEKNGPDYLEFFLHIQKISPC